MRQSRARELLAQAALGSVGLDSDADQHWLAAITDGNISPQERRELILSLHDAARAAQEDVPLIASRIALIEQAAPQVVDESVAAALQEAHRELLNTLATLTAAQTATTTPEPSDANADPAR